MAGKEVGKIKIGMYVDGDDLANSIDGELGKAEGKAAGRVGAFFKKMAVAGGAAIVATAAKSLFDFSGFQSSMNEVFTLLPGISGKAMDEMTGQVKSFSKEFGVLPDQVVPALYQALSAGVPPDNVFEFLETAQKAAKGGVTELATAVDGISSVVNAYGADVLSATQASDLMFTAVKLGKTTFDELSRSLFNVTPTTAALGVKFGDVTAALAAMTAQGVPTSVATTQLRQLFVELSKAGTGTAKVFEEISGKSFKEFIAAGGDTQGALKLLEQHAKDSGVGINDLFGSVEAGSAALALTGSGTDKFTDSLAGMAESAGATQGAFDRMNTGIGPIFDRLKARGKVALLDLGEGLAKAGTQAVEAFTQFRKLGEWEAHGPWERLGVAVAKVVGFIQANAIPAATALGVVLVALLVPALTAAAGAVAAIFSPVVLIVGAIALLAAGVVYAYQHFEGFRTVVDAVAGFLVDTVWPKIQQFAQFIADKFGELVGWVRENWDSIQEAIGHVVAAVQAVIETFIAIVQVAWKTWGDEILNIASIIWDQIKNVVETAINIVRGIIETVVALINGDWGKAWDAIKGILSDAWEGIKTTASNAMKLLREGIEAGISGVVTFMKEVPGKILDALGDLGTMLLEAGKAIMRGLRDGIVAGFEAVKNFVGGIASKIASLKGPLDYDKRLLTPAGKAIMGGLIAGLRAEEGRLVNQLSHITGMFEGFGPSALTGPEVGPGSFTSPTHLPSPSRLSAEIEARAGAGVNEERLARLIAAELAANPSRSYVVASDISKAQLKSRRP